MGDPVTLVITDTECPGHRSVAMVMERPRAKAIVAVGEANWPRYRFTIEPRGGRMGLGTLIVIAGKVLGVVEAHKAVFAALATLIALFTLAVLGILLPEAHYRATPVALLMVGSFFAGILSDRNVK